MPRSSRTRTRDVARRTAPIALVSLVTSGAAAWWSFGALLPAWNTPHTGIEAVAHERSRLPPAPALARRATLLVIDGLAFDAASELAELAPLRDEGATRPLIAHYPTYTGPNITAMLTGWGAEPSALAAAKEIARFVPGGSR